MTRTGTSGDPARIHAIQGQFAIVQKRGNLVRMARSIGRPMRYFLAKQVEGPCLVVAERMEQLREQLEKEGLGDQFHPSYTRMGPAHHLVEIVGHLEARRQFQQTLVETGGVLPAMAERARGHAVEGRRLVQAHE